MTDFDDRLSNQIKEAYYGSFLGFSFGFVEPGAEGFDFSESDLSTARLTKLPDFGSLQLNYSGRNITTAAAGPFAVSVFETIVIAGNFPSL